MVKNVDVAGKAGEPVRGRFADFNGRRIAVKAPTEGQLVVISRFARKFGDTNGRKPELATADEAVKALSRVFDIIASVLIDPADIDFVEDSIMSGEVDLTDALELMGQAVDVLAADSDSTPQAALVTGT